MSVNNGQAVNAEVSNAAWLSRKVNTSMVGALLLGKLIGSGAQVSDVQKLLNLLITNIGMQNENDDNLIYPSNNFVADGDPLTEAIGNLDAALLNVIDSIDDIFANPHTWASAQTFAGPVNFDSGEDNTTDGEHAVVPLIDKTVIRVTNVGLISVGGIGAPDPVNSRFLMLTNDLAGTLKIEHLCSDPGVTAGEQIKTPSNSDMLVPPGVTIIMFYNKDAGKWTVIGGGGGGGAGGAASLNWNAPEGVGALLLEENGIKVYSFSTDYESQKITALIQVPSSFGTGNQPVLKILSYANDTDYHAFKVTTTLLKPTL